MAIEASAFLLLWLWGTNSSLLKYYEQKISTSGYNDIAALTVLGL
jgi:hypothetical protein